MSMPFLASNLAAVKAVQHRADAATAKAADMAGKVAHDAATLDTTAAQQAIRDLDAARQKVDDAGKTMVNIVDMRSEPVGIGEILTPGDFAQRPSALKPTLTFKAPDLDIPDDNDGVKGPGALSKTVTFMPSQIGRPDEMSVSYTATPLKLLWYDLQLTLGRLPSAMGVMRPWRMGKDADPFDEMYPNGSNLLSIGLHAVLIVTQLFFITTLPWHVFTPIGIFAAYVACFIFFNTLICMVLNGTELKVLPGVEVDPKGEFNDEYWIYLNGVSVGQAWLQSNVNRLSLTFGRKVVGVHNTTSGIIFDVLQCLLQRNFAYSTQDVREAYACIKEALLDPEIKRVVFILHSQGGIEGGLILDWLFAEVSRDALKRLEVYTFGNAANHFNNPDFYDSASSYGKKMMARTAKEQPVGVPDKGDRSLTKVLGHIEHYANAGDFVSQFGVLNYTRMQNRYMGRLFLAPGSGHLLNQHYLYKMFALNEERTACADTNDFMEMEVRLNKHDVAAAREDLASSLESALPAPAQMQKIAFVGDVNAPVKPLALVKQDGGMIRLKVKHFSRLWLYRNGGSPDDDD